MVGHQVKVKDQYGGDIKQQLWVDSYLKKASIHLGGALLFGGADTGLQVHCRHRPLFSELFCLSYFNRSNFS